MKTEYTAAYLFGGLGGGALGFKGARAEYMGKQARFRNICSIDADPVVCRNYETITGGRAVQMDLFDCQQYCDFHGVESPPADWLEAEPWDIWQAFGEEVPDVVFTSPPCKGFSGLLPEKSAASKKYQALNLLTIRGIDIALAACWDYGGELPALFLLENVPRIMTRGKHILDKIKATLAKYGYLVNDETHDCGEIGGLGQHRKRYLLIARNEKRMPAFVYKPEKKPLKTIGDVIGSLPLPGDEINGGPMHRIPMLQRKTWERLAFIPAGGDWRDLEGIEYEKYRLQYEPRGAGAFGVQDWNEPSNTVTGQAKVNGSSGCAAVADPRTGFKNGTHASIYRVSKFGEPSPTVTGAGRPNNGALSVSDPRLNERESRHPGVYRIVRYDEPAPCITGTRFGSGAIAVADARVNTVLHPDSYGVQAWDDSSKTVRSASRIMQSASSIADPRINNQYHNGTYRVTDWDETSPTVTTGSVSAGSGKAVSDPRLSPRNQRYPGTFRVEDYDKPSNTVLGQTDIQCGALSVGDPRLGCVQQAGKYGVQDWKETGDTVAGYKGVHSGSSAISDPRLGCSPRAGSYGVQKWDDTATTVIGAGDVHSGSAAVADPRIPEQNERCVMIIIAEDGTWHRPLTTYELAALQGFPSHLPDGRPFHIEGCSDAKAREYVGNAVPPDAAQGMANVILMALVLSAAGETFTLSWDPVWVAPEEEQLPTLVH